jgi:NAD(P)-dependent dehydrogenase (short-subunit alcohol dehydrogenase family)
MAGKVHWSPISEMDCEEWRNAVLSFPTAGMLTTKHASKAMMKNGGGSIIHLLSTAAHFGQPSGAAYCTAKAALLNFARSAAMELASAGIRVNTITPCAMEHQLWTKMRKEVAENRFERVKNRPQYSREQFFNQIPLGRFPRAADIAWAAVFLASDESCFITGADIPVDGGLRFKYPAWQASEGTAYQDYVASIERTAYGEPVGRLFPDDTENKPDQ